MDINYITHLFNRKEGIRAKTPDHRTIMELTQHLPSHYLPKQRLWHLINDVIDPPTCKMCNNCVRWEGAASFKNQGYRKYCSHKCQQNDPDVREQKKKTEASKYGKKREASIEKMKNTNMKKYGVEFAIQSEDVKCKRTKTCFDRFGVANPIQHPDIESRRVETNTKRYGGNAPAVSDIVKSKINATVQEKYGRHQSQRHLSGQQIAKVQDVQWLYEQHVVHERSVTNISRELGITVSRLLSVLKNNNIPIHKYDCLRSQAELEIEEFLTLLNVNFTASERKFLHPQELDFHLPDHNVAIEFNGLYWHSESNGKDQHYHSNKTAKCAELGIELIHIFENEWATKQTIIKSVLAGKVGSHMREINATQCSVVKMGVTATEDFLQEHHIQGGCRDFVVSLGLVYGDELVSVMVFDSFNELDGFEIVRFCNAVNTHVTDGANKLFSAFREQFLPSLVIASTDCRFGSDTTYYDMGFVHSHKTPPVCHYFKRGSVMLENSNSVICDWNNTIDRGYDRVWDCGHNVWRWQHTIT